MTPENRDYWIQLVDKLNANDNDNDNCLPDFLQELCSFFGYGCSFVYEANHAGIFRLTESFQYYSGCHTPRVLDMPALLGKELMEKLAKQRLISFRDTTTKNTLAKRLADMLSARSIILIPVTGPDSTLIAFVGMVDRRGKSREIEDDLPFAHSILGTLATYTKMQIYRKRAETTRKSLESVMDNMGVDVYVNDYKTHEILYTNRSMAQPYGSSENLLGKTCWSTLYDDRTAPCDYCPQSKLIDENGNPTKTYSWDYRRPFDGSWFRVISAAFRWVDGRLAHVVSSVDITENKRNEELVRQMAEYDNLTSLPNRAKLVADCDERIPVLLSGGEEGFMIFFDLDGFKSVNDTLGHRAGDELLASIGAVLQESPFTRGRSYRYGGDEFVILGHTNTPGSLAEILSFLQQTFTTPWKLEDGEVLCGASIGISLFPQDNKSTSHLLRMADQAMYFAKREGKGRVYYYNNGNPCPAEAYNP